MKIERVQTSGVELTPFDSDKMILASDFMAVIETKKDGVIRVYVEEGFLTDLASIPAVFRWMFPRYGNREYLEGICLHDIGFASQKLTFELSNSILEFKLKKSGLSKFKRFCMMKAVSSKIGRKHYNTIDSWDRLNEDKIKIKWDSK